MVTKEAMTTMKIGMRTISGTIFFISEITTFEQIRTNMVANPIPIPLMADDVVPKVGHIPNKSTNVGFSLIIPFSNTFKLFIDYLLPICSVLYLQMIYVWNLSQSNLLFHFLPAAKLHLKHQFLASYIPNMHCLQPVKKHAT